MNKVKVSFIIPVHNAGQYLSHCLDSVINQTERNIEIICVNDCSRDNSRTILEACRAKDHRIRLIEFRENKGPGAARNAGLDAVTGDYIRMVDADDYIPLDSTEKLVNAAEQYESNYVRGGFRFCSATGGMLAKGWHHPELLIVNTAIQREQILWRFNQHCSYLYRTTSLLKTKARYDESMRNAQDAAFLIDLLPHLERVTIIPETVYYYRKNPDSITYRKWDKDYYINLLSVQSRAYRKLTAYDLKEIADYIFYTALSHNLPNKLLVTIPDCLDHEDGVEVLAYLSSILKEHNGKDLCFSRTYTWQDDQQIPWLSKYLVLLLHEGYLDDAYHDLKLIRESRKHGKNRNGKLHTCEDELEKIHASLSWKLTMPLRKLGASSKLLQRIASLYIRRLLADLRFEFKRIYRKLRRKPHILLVYPENPDHSKLEYVIKLICRELGCEMMNDPHRPFHKCLLWEDKTFKNVDPQLAMLISQGDVINGQCLDISKTRVDKIFTEVFGYSSFVDPLHFEGECVEKTDLNGKRDGKIVRCPVEEHKEGMVYQRLIDNRCEKNGLVVDLRVPVFRGMGSFVYHKYKPIDDRFKYSIGGEMELIDETFTKDEISKINTFCQKMGFDYGELDILRDKLTQKIYIVDANVTPTHRFVGYTRKQEQYITRELCRGFDQAFLT